LAPMAPLSSMILPVCLARAYSVPYAAENRL
jgi:hypothetical protein